jgi:alpha-1,2-mannosyltransferase
MYTHPSTWTLDPVDLGVYQSGGLIVRHIRPLYHPHLAAPLYDWAGYQNLHLKFTYAPFAAVVFAVISVIPWRYLPGTAVVANIILLIAAAWFTFGGLGYRRSLGRLGAALLTAAALFWTEPVIRNLYLGQIDLVLLALVLWDLCQPDTKASRWWKGAGIGIAAGIKLVPLIFIPYLLLTRKFRQALVASVAFAVTIAVGFLFLPADSAKWWFGGLFYNGGRTGFVGWEGNQSLRAIITRLAGSVAAGAPIWLVVAAITTVVGLGCAAILDRAGHRMAGILACALTGLLVSPISWDHHWVWIIPAVATAAVYALRAAGLTAGPAAAPPGAEAALSGSSLNGSRPSSPGLTSATLAATGPAGAGSEMTGHGPEQAAAGPGTGTGTAEARRASPAGAVWRRVLSLPALGCWALAAGILALFGAWPGSLWGDPTDLGDFSLGLIWQPPNTNPTRYYRRGDRPGFAEYHWHGIQLLTGNAYLLGGLALMALLVVFAAVNYPARSPARPTDPLSPRLESSRR